MAIDEILLRCCGCKKIQILREQDVWISKEENAKQYQKIVRQFKLSDGYCAECGEKLAERYGI